MATFLIHETMLTETTFVRRIEADDIDDAYQAAYDGYGDLLGVSIGDQHPGVDRTEVFDDNEINMPPCFYPESS
mgnify:CR=1 FL=1